MLEALLSWLLCLGSSAGTPVTTPSGCGCPKASCVGNTFVTRGLSVANAAHKLLSYPLGYSLVVLPLTIARWSLFNHKSVSSAATFLVSLCSTSLARSTSFSS